MSPRTSIRELAAGSILAVLVYVLTALWIGLWS
jgi:hypothetical protein